MALPWAARSEALRRAPVVVISDGIMTLDGAAVATERELAAEDGPDWKIARISEHLGQLRSNWLVVNAGRSFPGEMLLLADRKTSFRTIKKVLYSAGLAGYAHPSFVVRSGR